MAMPVGGHEVTRRRQSVAPLTACGWPPCAVRSSARAVLRPQHICTSCCKRAVRGRQACDGLESVPVLHAEHTPRAPRPGAPQPRRTCLLASSTHASRSSSSASLPSFPYVSARLVAVASVVRCSLPKICFHAASTLALFQLAQICLEFGGGVLCPCCQERGGSFAHLSNPLSSARRVRCARCGYRQPAQRRVLPRSVRCKG